MLKTSQAAAKAHVDKPDCHPTKSKFPNSPPGKRKRYPRVLALTLLLILGAIGPPASVAGQETAIAAASPSHEPTLRPAAADIPFSQHDSDAEELLLDLANQARAEVGAPALKLESGLSQAARLHAEAMLSAHRLSHQLESEPSLAQRLADATRAQLDEAAENIALDYGPEEGHHHFMLSPAHRANLLNPAYNVIGIAVVNAGDRLYIVQDFAHALPRYSSPELKDRIAATIAEVRHQAKQPQLARLDSLSYDSPSKHLLSKNLPSADEAACSMAKADKLITSPLQQLASRYTVAVYTTLRPNTLPANSAKVISTLNFRSFSLGACYARTQTYPTGVYWIVVAMK